MSPPGTERRAVERRSCSLYLQFVIYRTGELMGTLADISRCGFRLESTRAIPVQTDYVFRVDVPRDISIRPYITLVGRSRWSRRDPIDSRLYNTGFEIVGIHATEVDAVERILERYGAAPIGAELRMNYIWGR